MFDDLHKQTAAKKYILWHYDSVT